MIDKPSIARRVLVFAVSMVALYRLHLVGFVIGPEQVMQGLAQTDRITIAITVTLLLNSLAVLLTLSGRKLGLLLGYLILLINIVFSGPCLLQCARPRNRRYGRHFDSQIGRCLKYHADVQANTGRNGHRTQ